MDRRTLHDYLPGGGVAPEEGKTGLKPVVNFVQGQLPVLRLIDGLKRTSKMMIIWRDKKKRGKKYFRYMNCILLGPVDVEAKYNLRSTEHQKIETNNRRHSKNRARIGRKKNTSPENKLEERFYKRQIYYKLYQDI